MVENILILTDFSGGTWDAVSFAMKFLKNGNTTVNLLQTYQKPDMGQSMIRNIVPILKKISIDNLDELRSKILDQYEIPKKKIKSLSLEGNLTSLLVNQVNLSSIDNVVVGLHSSIPDTGFLIRRKIARVTKYCTQPLFIIPSGFSESELLKIIFVSDPSIPPSAKILDKLRYLESSVGSGIQILFLVKNDPPNIPEDIVSGITSNLPGIDVTTNYLHNGSKEFNLDSGNSNLVVIEKTTYQKFRRIITRKLKLSHNYADEIPGLLIVP